MAFVAGGTMSRAVFPGTFDPITLGHEALVRRAAQVFDEIIVGIARGVHKRAAFSTEERMALAAESFADSDNIRVAAFDGLLADFVRAQDCRVILRGLRAVSDFEFESQLFHVNRILDGGIETLFMPPDSDYIYVSSTIVREIAQLGGDAHKFVSPHVAAALAAKPAWR